MNDPCDFDDCNAEPVGDYSIGLFYVQFCAEHRNYFQDRRTQYFEDQRRKAMKRR